MLVADASAVLVALVDEGPDGDRARRRMRNEELAAPEIVDLEVASVLRRQVGAGALDESRAELALFDLAELALQRAPHLPLVPRCWELGENLSVDDAAYVALAEALQTTLLTTDRRLSRALGPTCRIELLS